MFKSTNRKVVCGHLIGYVTTTGNRLDELFGAPETEIDEYKVSQQWTVEHESGELLYIYDWKCTSMYDPEYPSPAQWKMQSSVNSYEWHIGGTDRALAAELAEYISNTVKFNAYNSNEDKLNRLKSIAASQSNKISAKYSPIDSQQLIDDTMNTLRAIGLNDIDVSIDATGGTRGTKHFINFRLNDLTFGIDGGLTPRIIIENSYLGECAASISVGLYRFVCSNGLVLGEDFFAERIQHVSGPKFYQKIGGLHSGIASAVNTIENDLANLISELQSVELNFAEQLRLIVSLKMSDKLTESVVNRLYVQSSLRVEDRPKNVWTTYNIINEVMRESTRSDYSFTSKNINLLDDIRRLVA